MKERIELLCKMLGVELEEEFMLETHTGSKWKITDKGLEVNNHNKKYCECDMNLNYLLTAKVIKFPWKPKEFEEFYTLDYLQDKGYCTYINNGSKFAKRTLIRCEVYKTEEEAIAAVKEKGWSVE